MEYAVCSVWNTEYSAPGILSIVPGILSILSIVPGILSIVPGILSILSIVPGVLSSILHYDHHTASWGWGYTHVCVGEAREVRDGRGEGEY
jgi:hypothetical protein